MKKLENKVVFITGGASGLGRAAAAAAAREGGQVVIADLPGSDYQAALDEVKAAGRDGFFVPLDVTDPVNVQQAVAATVAKYGRLDVALNNAGIGEGFFSFLETSEESFRRILDVNLTGVFVCMKHELAQFMKQGGGVIVNMSSLAGLKGAPGLSAYVASKHGVLGLTKTAAQEFARRNVRVNALCPYYIDTPLIKDANPDQRQQMIAASPMKRLGTAEEVAKAFIYLASDDSSYTNGTQLVIDSGVLS
ncbi:SDR family NAD(P)-dependent oxidoreductase [Hymenobacter caeli]|uniref:NAD(P)-dependent dehydrogenase (Short-subunit alcohol dehydrogenase family) n=1 Tax=Hymenobacter caeli TaxID=2735894 RepID=A0ABX2FPQ5_9BACT|nr:glucose 1-dehydrogenase [Hymenobacter caeli]NRT18828.1 NAD(P)-dependent dehydrogenase (short-subunit alcohol dehydrogenase family) [Hymenobacter caeli]